MATDKHQSTSNPDQGLLGFSKPTCPAQGVLKSEFFPCRVMRKIDTVADRALPGRYSIKQSAQAEITPTLTGSYALRGGRPSLPSRRAKK